jgi:hypothetical protein
MYADHAGGWSLLGRPDLVWAAPHAALRLDPGLAPVHPGLAGLFAADGPISDPWRMRRSNEVDKAC